jgi:hypothetical protein
MREDGWLTGYGTATALYDVPALERSHATLPGRALGPVMSSARGADRAGDHLDRAPAGAAARGEDPLRQKGSPVQVPMTVEPPAGQFTECVVRT